MDGASQFYFWNTFSIIGGDFDTEGESFGVVNRGEAPRCPTCGRYIGSIPRLPPYRVRLICRGRRGIGDVAYEVGNLFVSSRFRAGYEEFGLTGLTFTPAEVVAIRGRKQLQAELPSLPPFFHASISRGNAAIDVVRSETRLGPVECQTCRTMRQLCRTKRIVLEDGTWDGLDVFIPRGMPGTVLVTDRFEQMCNQYGITNVKLIPAEEYSFDSMPWLRGIDEETPADGPAPSPPA